MFIIRRSPPLSDDEKPSEIPMLKVLLFVIVTATGFVAFGAGMLVMKPQCDAAWSDRIQAGINWQMLGGEGKMK